MRLSDCNTIEEIHDYLKLKAENHNYLKIYGKRAHIEYMLQENALFLSKGNNWNDIDDARRFDSDVSQDYFGRCFSFSKSENVAMWMLYARNPEDLMINISPSVVRNSINNIDCVQMGKWDDNKFLALGSLNRADIEIEFLDIVYCDEVSDRTAIKRSTENVETISRELLSQITYYKKSYPWNYENECRLIIKIPRKRVSDDVTVVRIELQGLQNNFKVFSNPQNEEECGHERSTLRGTMHWNI